ncbi:hypothetical protein [Streptomyces viridochromogenes]|uniref:Uncharacterized protein n=1 Tax=Streptomyces viridochromogenes Tue57 TaxID=1160705 RepID=L8PL28_STRVR|nr:hypothetical protein STVIR_0838 [Streptomyces viridochromogenes Tue57]
MRGEGHNLGSALTFVVLFHRGDIVGMLVAGRASDRFGAPRISVVWFALTAAGVLFGPWPGGQLLAADRALRGSPPSPSPAWRPRSSAAWPHCAARSGRPGPTAGKN